MEQNLNYSVIDIEFQDPSNHYSDFLTKVYDLIEPHLRGQVVLTTAILHGPLKGGNFSKRRWQAAIDAANNGQLEGIQLICGKGSYIYSNEPAGVALSLGYSNDWSRESGFRVIQLSLMIGHHFFTQGALVSIQKEIENLWWTIPNLEYALCGYYQPIDIVSQESMPFVELQRLWLATSKLAYVADRFQTIFKKVIGDHSFEKTMHVGFGEVITRDL
jgi:hypothetical protein